MLHNEIYALPTLDTTYRVHAYPVSAMTTVPLWGDLTANFVGFAFAIALAD